MTEAAISAMYTELVKVPSAVDDDEQSVQLMRADLAFMLVTCSIFVAKLPERLLLVFSVVVNVKLVVCAASRKKYTHVLVVRYSLK